MHEVNTCNMNDFERLCVQKALSSNCDVLLEKQARFMYRPERVANILGDISGMGFTFVDRTEDMAIAEKKIDCALEVLIRNSAKTGDVIVEL